MGTIRKRKTAELRDEKGKIVKHSRTRYRAEIFLQGHPRVSQTFWDQKKQINGSETLRML